MTSASLRLASLLAALALPVSAQTVTTTLLNDTFADGERSTQALNASAQWFSSAASSNLSVTNNALVTAATVQTTLTYFTSGNSPVSLAVGESLKVAFDVSFAATGNSAAGFRVGFFDSDDRVSGDSFSNSNAVFADGYAGYIGGVNTAATANNILRLYERSGSTNLIGGSIGTGYTQIGSGGGAFKTFVAGSVYSASFTLTRTASSISAVLSYTGVFTGDSVSSTQTATIADTTAPSTIFDTLAFYNTSGGGFTLDNVAVDYTSLASVPEPASAAALFGVLALSSGALRRRRRA